MRRLRRRRPAGSAQVPMLVESVADARVVLPPCVVRIGPDRTLLDAPWDIGVSAIAHVWLHDSRGWLRVPWPRGPSGRFVAPLDLHLGHVLEVSARDVIHACVAEADAHRMVLVPAPTLGEAVSMAQRAVDAWRVSELAATAEAWRQRISTSGLQNGSGG